MTLFVNTPALTLAQHRKEESFHLENAVQGLVVFQRTLNKDVVVTYDGLSAGMHEVEVEREIEEGQGLRWAALTHVILPDIGRHYYGLEIVRRGHFLELGMVPTDCFMEGRGEEHRNQGYFYNTLTGDKRRIGPATKFATPSQVQTLTPNPHPHADHNSGLRVSFEVGES